MLPARDREDNIACDLNDMTWLERIDASEGVVLFAAGVFYYSLTEPVKSLVRAAAKAFPGGKLVFDAAGKSAVELMLKTRIKSAKIRDVGAYFAVRDAVRELSAWDGDFRVSSRGHMLGYNDLKTPSVSAFFRLLAEIGDRTTKMQIVRLDFVGAGSRNIFTLTQKPTDYTVLTGNAALQQTVRSLPCSAMTRRSYGPFGGQLAPAPRCYCSDDVVGQKDYSHHNYPLDGSRSPSRSCMHTESGKSELPARQRPGHLPWLPLRCFRRLRCRLP